MRRSVLVLGSLLTLTSAAIRAESIPPVPAASLPEPGGDSMEGIALGEAFDAVNARMNLRNIIPGIEGEDVERYRWPASIDEDPPDRVEGAQQIRALEIVFRDDIVVEVRSTYRSRAAYSRMGPDLIARYGEPTVVRAGPPRKVPGKQVGATPEIGTGEPVYRVPEAPSDEPLYLWVEQWAWGWEGATFEVVGEHYTADPGRIAVGLHIFRFRLTDRSYRE
ncbi:MAG: hypothetical protein PVF68_04380 [Acidobacteriota bacterium]